MEWLLLQLDQGVYAVRRAEVADVRPSPILFRPPLTPKEMAGVVSLDGKTCVLADLAASLGFSPVDRKEGLTLLILNPESELPGFVLAAPPKQVVEAENAVQALPDELSSNLCHSWLQYQGRLLPVLELSVLQYLLMAGERPAETFPETVTFNASGEPATQFWSFTLHGKPFVLATQSLRVISELASLAPLFSLPDFIPALVLEGGQALPACDLAGLLFDAPLDQGQLVATDDGQWRAAFWIDPETPQRVEGEVKLLPHLVARQGLNRSLIRGGEIFPVIDPGALFRSGRSWHDVSLQGNQPMPRAASSWESVVEVSINATRYAMPRGVVTRELPVQKITPLPAAPAIVCGLTLYEEELLPVLDFTPYFGRRAEVKASSRLLLVQDQGFRAMLLVEEVFQGRHLSDETRRQLPFQLKEGLVCGCYVDDRDVLLVLDPVAMAYGFREEIVRDFRRQLVASGFVESDAMDAEGDWWEILEGVGADELAYEASTSGTEAPTDEIKTAASEIQDHETAVSVSTPPSDVVVPELATTAPDIPDDHDDELAGGAAVLPPLEEPPAGEMSEDLDAEPLGEESTPVREVRPSETSVMTEANLDDALSEMSPELFDGEGLTGVSVDVPPDENGEALNEGEISLHDEQPEPEVTPDLGEEWGGDISGLEMGVTEPPASSETFGDSMADDAPFGVLATELQERTDDGEVPQDVPLAQDPDVTSVLTRTGQESEDRVTAYPERAPRPDKTSRRSFEEVVEDGVDFVADDGESIHEDAPLIPEETGARFEPESEIEDAGEPAQLEDDHLFAEAFAVDDGVIATQEVPLMPGNTPDASSPDEPGIAAEESAHDSRRHAVWSHAARSLPEPQPAPHVQHEPKEKSRKARRPKQVDLLVLLLLLLLGWWMYTTYMGPGVPEVPAPESSRRNVPAQTAPLPPAAEETGVAAEPRVPLEAGDASLGKLEQEELTIVIPAELLKDDLRDEDLVVTIKWGDTLWELAERYTGNPWNYRQIAHENNIRNPNLIFPRQKLNIRTEK